MTAGYWGTLEILRIRIGADLPNNVCIRGAIKKLFGNWTIRYCSLRTLIAAHTFEFSEQDFEPACQKMFSFWFLIWYELNVKADGYVMINGADVFMLMVVMIGMMVMIVMVVMMVVNK